MQEYRDSFRRQRGNAADECEDGDFVWRKLVLRWKTPVGRWPTDEDEVGANKLARVLDPIITPSGLGEIDGFEHGTGQIDVLVFGRATDSHGDQIHELLAPSFRALRWPAGSRMIGIYRERNEEIESDVVPENAR